MRTGSFDVASGGLYGRDLLALPEPPTAIMAADDEIAVGGLAAARTFGVPVSERLRVVRFDDTPQAPWITPLHTTVHQHLDGTGRMAAQTVVAMSSDTAPPPATST